MEAIGAVAAILQVAQIGTQVSIALYQVASAISSAAKEIKYIAKDVALFSAVLKDLSRALNLGSKANIFRKDAFDTSVKIVGECKGVFTEIEDILKHVTKNEAPLHQRFEIPRTEKVLWYFRKGKVDFLRGILESLKSTISLELAVLNYATKVSSPLTKDTVDVDELLTLKSLVLANESSTKDLRELAKAQGAGERSLGLVASDGLATYQHPSIHPQVGLLTQDAPPDKSQCMTQTEEQSTPLIFSESIDEPYYPGRTPPYWTRMDHFEFALQRFNLAKWEHERIEENVALRCKSTSSLENQKKEDFLLSRLRAVMTKFGLDPSLVERALEILQKSESRDTSRTEICYTAPKTESMINSLELAGMSWADNESDDSALLVRRWLPDMFSDVLWDHTRTYLRQNGLCALTRSEFSPLGRSPLARPAKSGKVDAGTQTDYPETARESISPSLLPFFVSPARVNGEDTQMSSARARDRDISYHKDQPQQVRPEDLKIADMANLYPEQLNVRIEEGATNAADSAVWQCNSKEDKQATTSRREAQVKTTISEEVVSLKDIEEANSKASRSADTTQWLDSLPELSAPFGRQRVGEVPSPRRIDLADDEHQTKRRRINPQPRLNEGRDKWDPDEQAPSPGLELESASDTSEGSPIISEEEVGHARNRDAIMTYAQQRPQARNAPASSNQAISMFAEYSDEAARASVVATAGSEESDFDFVLYQERRQKGIEGREEFFRRESDQVLQTVDGLLRRWTFIDVLHGGQADGTAEQPPPPLLQDEEID